MSETRVVHVADKIPDAVYIGRAMPRQRLKASPLQNPFTVKEHGLNGALQRFTAYLEGTMKRDPAFAEALIAARDCPLSCWCRHDGETKTQANACHGDFIIAVLDEFTDAELRRLALGPDQPSASRADAGRGEEKER